MFKHILYGIVLGIGAPLSIVIGVIMWLVAVIVGLIPWFIKIGVIAGLVYLFLRLFGLV